MTKSILILLMILSFAVFSTNMIANLILLLFLAISSIFWLQSGGYTIWGSVLILIVFLTGLFIIFSYMVSTMPFDNWKTFSLIFSTCFFLLLSLMVKKKKVYFSKIFFFSFDWSLGGVFFMTFLLFIIVIFMRSTYGKGGALRKKF